jgi:hypothetical protein
MSFAEKKREKEEDDVEDPVSSNIVFFPISFPDEMMKKTIFPLLL